MAEIMCGIAGSSHDPAGRAARAMAAKMVHRGPDDHGVYVDPNRPISLSARRLAVIDVEGGHQPVGNEDGSVWAVLNGEIYNHSELRRHLRRRGHVFESGSDTEVLAHLYEEYGEALVHAIEGMFSFAIWDRKSSSLLLGRDRFGEKPLFYSAREDRLTFASEVSALRAGLPEEPDIDPAAFDQLFVLGYVSGESTIFAGIDKLPPACILRWSTSAPRPKISRYWSLAGEPSRRKGNIDELAEEGEALLRDAVRSRLAADVPVGVFLSGGLDSTLVAALAAEEVGGALRTFTVSYDAGAVSEGAEASATARTLGSRHREVVMESDEVERRVTRLLGDLDQPNADPALVPLSTVAAAAKQDITVAVGGEGADELFGGYPRYRWLNTGGAIDRWLPDRLGQAAAGIVRCTARGRARRLADLIAPGDPGLRNLDWVTDGRRRFRGRLYGPTLAGHEPSHLLDESALALSNGGDPATAAMALDRRRYLPDDVLAKADRATMLAGLEMRTPYLSRNLAEFSATIPTDIHLDDGGKAVLRAIARRLQAMPRRRPKRPFGVPVAQWLRGPLADSLSHQATDGCLVREGWLDPAGLRPLVAGHLAGRHDHASVLWPVVVAGLWLDRLRGS